MSKLLNSLWSRAAATTAAPAAPSGVASTMFALGATRWAAFGLRVAAVGLVSAGATAFDAYDGAPADATAAPIVVVAEPSVAPVAPPVAPVEHAARADAPAIDQGQVTPPPVLERTAARSPSPTPRAAEPRKDGPEASDPQSRQGRDQVRELIRRGHCGGSCPDAADATR